MIKVVAITVCILTFQITVSAQKHTIFGTIRDVENGEHLIGATISAQGKNLGTSSNNYGFYSLTLPDGTYDILYSFVGYRTISHQIELSADTTINVGLEPEITSLDEVVVEAKENSRVFINQM